MERLTERRDAQWVIPLRKDGKQKWALCEAGMSLDDSTEYLYGDHANRLAAYEDKGLEPEAILTGKELAEIACAINLLKEYQAIGSVERFRELAQAEKDERLLVLPVKEGTTIYRVRLNFDGDHYEIIEKDFDLARFRPEDFGRIVFKTREEAEAALKKREEADNEAD